MKIKPGMIGLPNELHLRAIVDTLIRLQEFYKIKTKRIANGYLLNESVTRSVCFTLIVC